MKGRILVVDDEEDIRMILRASLEDDFEIVEAHDGLDALEKLERYEPDFICLDVMMPLMDGFETCSSIRSNGKYNDIPIMFLTALGKKEDIKTGYGKGANLYLTKPFDPDRLLKNIKVHFGQMQGVKKKKYTIEQINEFEASGTQPVAPGGAQFELPNTVSQESRDRIMQSSGTVKKPTNEFPIKPTTKPRVLVIDDDEDILMIMEQSLSPHAEVIKATDGLQAVQYLVKYQPDMLIIDIMIPKMNGFQLCQSLRSNQAFEKIPILMCSAKSRDKDIDMSKKAGANLFLAKPFETKTLVDQFKALQKIDGYRLRPVKKVTWEEILKEREPKESEDVFQAEVEHRHKLEEMTKQALQDASSDEVKRESDIKPKRRLFGFGKK